MKKIITSAGCLALGVAGLNAAFVFPDTARVDPSKFWSASLALRGFYDDNPTTVHDHEQDGWGVEVRPNLAIDLWPQSQTHLGLSYTYSMKYYEQRDDNNADHYHDLMVNFDHAFNERYRLAVTEWFTVAQEPQVLDTGGGVTVPIRTKGDNIRNRVSLDLNGELTERLGFSLGYANTFYDYDQSGPGSYSALLDRMEHLAHLDLRWRIKNELIGIFGYQFGYNDYEGKGQMIRGLPITSETRNSYAHYVYVGWDNQWTPKLKNSLRIGGQFTDYTDAFAGTDDQWSPYVNNSITYTYSPDGYVTFGGMHNRMATDVVAASFRGRSVTEDQEATSVYLTWNHKWTPRLTSNLLGQYQVAEFYGGRFDGQEDKLYTLGANLDYKFTKNWGIEGGYNYDKLDSDVPNRGYSRNRVYFGVRATY